MNTGTAPRNLPFAAHANEKEDFHENEHRTRRCCFRSYDYDQPLRAGVVLPEDYAYYDVPERYHVKPGYRYTVVNRRPVIVEPRTRRVVEIIE